MSRAYFYALIAIVLIWAGHTGVDSPSLEVRTTGPQVPVETLVQPETEPETAMQPIEPPAPTTTTTRAVIHTASVAAPAPAPGSNYQRFVRLGDCESGDRYRDAAGHLRFVEGSARWDLNTGNGYYGGIQFSASTWHQAGGTGLPHEHTRDEQIAVAESWLARTSWSQWPECSRSLGYQ